MGTTPQPRLTWLYFRKGQVQLSRALTPAITLPASTTLLSSLTSPLSPSSPGLEWNG